MKSDDLDKLLDGYLDGSLQDDEFEYVWDLLKHHPEVESQLAQLSMVRHMLIRLGRQGIPIADESTLREDSSGSLEKEDFKRQWTTLQERPGIDKIKARAENQLSQFLAEQERLRREMARSNHPELRISIDWRGVARKIDRIAAFTKKLVVRSALAAGCLLVGIIVIQHFRTPRVIGKLSETVHARWAVAPDSNDLKRGNLILKQGYAKIRFNSGAEVILEAPADLLLEKENRLSLRRGKLTAIAEDEAKGFTVRTPGASIVDLGTEFGVWVKQAGGSEAHVFKGEVKVISRAKRSSSQSSQVLHAAQACAVDQAGIFAQRTRAARKDLFQRYLPSPYELAVNATDPLFCYQIDRDHPNQWFDVITRRHVPMQYIGAVSFGQGPPLGGGKRTLSVRFDGQGSYAVVRYTVVPGDEPTTGYSTMVWVRPHVIRKQIILRFSQGPKKQRILAMTSDGYIEQWFVGPGGTIEADTMVRSLTKTRADQWYHLVALRNAVGDPQQRKLFINGVQEGATLCEADAPAILPVLHLGGVGYDDTESDLSAFQGEICAPIHYNRALNNQEIKTIYQAAEKKR